MLGAERLFENEPTIEFGELSVGERSSGTTTMTVAVAVKDGIQSVAVDAAKVAALFEATSDLGDWNGAAKLTPAVNVVEGEGNARFTVSFGEGAGERAFLRIRK